MVRPVAPTQPHLGRLRVERIKETGTPLESGWSGSTA